MCFSAQVIENWRQFLRTTGISLSIKDFHDLERRRLEELKAFQIRRGLDGWFAEPQTVEEEAVKRLVLEYRTRAIDEEEQRIAKQRTRLATAEEKLHTKPTKTAAEEQRKADKSI